MDFDTISSKIAGIPHMSSSQGRVIYDHLCRTGATQVLELGTAHGVSASYMGAAIEANGGGYVNTIDSIYGARHYDPSAAQTVAKAGLEAVVNRIELDCSSYNWWLMKQIAAQSDKAGNCEPVYDFCYIDGAHNFTVDGLAFFLVDKLLKPGGWLLLDDLKWTYASSNSESANVGELPLSDEEMHSPQIMPVFELLVQQHPDYAEFKVQDDNWGWAQKTPGAVARTLTVERTERLSARAVRLATRARRKLRRHV
jgi:predicted O-methyltransferase YrrM